MTLRAELESREREFCTRLSYYCLEGWLPSALYRYFSKFQFNNYIICSFHHWNRVFAVIYLQSWPGLNTTLWENVINFVGRLGQTVGCHLRCIKALFWTAHNKSALLFARALYIRLFTFHRSDIEHITLSATTGISEAVGLFELLTNYVLFLPL